VIGPAPLEPTKTTVGCGCQFHCPAWLVAVTGSPLCGSVEVMSMSRSSIAAMPSASIAQLAYACGPQAMRTRWAEVPAAKGTAPVTADASGSVNISSVNRPGFSGG
jgi:hypothetical protein